MRRLTRERENTGAGAVPKTNTAQRNANAERSDANIVCHIEKCSSIVLPHITVCALCKGQPTWCSECERRTGNPNIATNRKTPRTTGAQSGIFIPSAYSSLADVLSGAALMLRPPPL